jgi:nicotinamide phosphoribosyltransferase
MFNSRAISAIDFYKADHRPQYPNGTELVSSNFTPRSARLGKIIAEYFNNCVVVWGLQAMCMALLIDLWNKTFFSQPLGKVVAHYKKRMDKSLGVGAIDVNHIIALHNLGYLPIEIKALEEGTLCPIGVPVFTIKNTLPEFFWLTNYLEPSLSACLWKYMTSATIAYQYRKIIDSWCDKTGGTKGLVPFQAHDFSFRGMSGLEDAVMSGSGHLLSFTGSDTVLAIDFLEDYYGADSEKEFIAGSVPATEHSVMCMGGEDDERATYHRLLTELYPNGLVSIVSDTWDYWNVITNIIPSLKAEILNRNGKFVVRPDSGDPVRIIGGYLPDELSLNDNATGYCAKDGSPLTEAEIKGSIQCLWDTFGGTVTDKGFKTLDSHIGLIYGDSITLERAEKIFELLAAKGFSSDNVVFGVGSYTYEYVTRDTFGFAMKATYGVVNGVGRDIHKDPKTDSGVKKSAKGLLAVMKEDSKLVLKQQCTPEEEQQGELTTLFKDGKLVRQTTLEEVRARLHKG